MGKRRSQIPIALGMKKNAFTLIELMFVTVIIFVIIGLSVPLFRKTYSDLTARDTAFTLSTMAGFAQEKAVLDRKIYKTVFNFDEGLYRLLESEEVEGVLVYKNAQGRFGRARRLPRGLFFKDPADTASGQDSGRHEKELFFYPDGRCDDLVIQVVDKSGAGYCLATKGFGNLAQVQEVSNEQ